MISEYDACLVVAKCSRELWSVSKPLHVLRKAAVFMLILLVVGLLLSSCVQGESVHNGSGSTQSFVQQHSSHTNSSNDSSTDNNSQDDSVMVAPASYLENPQVNGVFADAYEASWEYASKRLIWTAPVPSKDGAVFAVDVGGQLHIIANQGQSAKTVPLDQRPRNGGLLVAGRYYSVNRDNVITCVSDAGEKEWQFAAGGDVIGTPAVSSGGKVLISLEDGTTIALDPFGTELWRHTAMFGALSPAVFVAGSDYAARWVPLNGLILLDGTGQPLDISTALRFSQEAITAKLLSVQARSVVALDTTGTLHSFKLNGDYWQVATPASLDAGITQSAEGSVYIADFKTLWRYGSDGEKLFEITVPEYIAGIRAVVDSQGNACIALETGKVMVISPTGTMNQVFQCELQEDELVVEVPGSDDQGNLYLTVGKLRGAGRIVCLTPSVTDG